MRLQDVISIHFPAKTRWVVTAVAALREYAEGIGFDKTNASRICLALEEAVCYAISLGYDSERDSLRVTLGRTTLGLQITVTSKGLPLNEDSLPQFDRQRLESEGDMTGIHSHLIRSAVDKAVFSILKDNRRKITLFKNLPIAAPAKVPLQSEHSRPGLKDASLSTTIRPAGPDDAQSISRLALRAHGSLLFNADIYYPERVREMLDQGEMRSMVAETPQGEILGHGALVAEAAEALFEEITFGVVDRRLRGRNCSGAIAQALMANAVERDL
ncbi:MAG: ATP-binding protein, partial [Desulfonatronovibrio sp.]